MVLIGRIPQRKYRIRVRLPGGPLLQPLQVKNPDVVIAIAHGHLSQLFVYGNGAHIFIARLYLVFEGKGAGSYLAECTVSTTYKQGATVRLDVEDGGLCKL